MKKIFFLIIFLIFVFLITFNLFSKKPEVTVIVRSVGEITQQKCVENLEGIFGKKNVYLIKNITPLFEATKKSYKTAVKTRSKWVLFVDADTFVDKENIEIFIKKADEILKNDNKAFVFQGLLYDKFQQIYKQSGVWLYRNDKLPLARKFYGKCSSKLKPDDCLVSSLVESGYHSYGIELQIGIHDFFQSGESIVKKYVLRSARQQDKIDEWKKNWSKLSKTDEDFYWALKGVELYENLEDKNIINDAAWIGELLKKNNFNSNEFVQKKDELLNNKESSLDLKIEKTLEKYVQKPPKSLDEIEFEKSRKEKRKLI